MTAKTSEYVLGIFDDSITMSIKEIAAKRGITEHAVNTVLSRRVGAAIEVPPDLLKASTDARTRRRLNLPINAVLPERVARTQNGVGTVTCDNSYMPERYRRAIPCGIAWLNLESERHYER